MRDSRASTMTGKLLSRTCGVIHVDLPHSAPFHQIIANDVGGQRHTTAGAIAARSNTSGTWKQTVSSVVAPVPRLGSPTMRGSRDEKSASGKDCATTEP